MLIIIIMEGEDELLKKILEKIDADYIPNATEENRNNLKLRMYSTNAGSPNSKFRPENFDDIEGAHEYLRDLYKEIESKELGKYRGNSKIYDEHIKKKMRKKRVSSGVQKIFHEPLSKIEELKNIAPKESKELAKIEELKNIPPKENEPLNPSELEEEEEASEIEEEEIEEEELPKKQGKEEEELADIQQEIEDRTNIPLTLRTRVLDVINKFLDGDVLDAWNDIKKLAKNLTYSDIIKAIKNDPKLYALFEDKKGQNVLQKIIEKGNQKIYDTKNLTGLLETLVKNKKVAIALTIVIVTAGVTLEIGILSSQLEKYKKKHE